MIQKRQLKLILVCSVLLAVAAFVAAYILLPTIYKSEVTFYIPQTENELVKTDENLMNDLNRFINDDITYANAGISAVSVNRKNNDVIIVMSYKSDAQKTLIIPIIDAYMSSSDIKYNRTIEEGSRAILDGKYIAFFWAIVAGLAGFFIIFAILALKSSTIFDKKLKTPDRVEKKTGLEVTGVIPRDEIMQADQQGSNSIKNKLLYNMLLSVFQSSKKQQQRILITSIYPEEGREFVSKIISEWLYMKGKQCALVSPYFEDEHWWLKHQDTSGAEIVTVESLARKDIMIMILPPLVTNDYPIELIRDFDMAFLVCDADREWSTKDQEILDYFMEQSEQFLQIILNKACKDVVEDVLKQINVTYFASADRSSKRKIKREHKKITNSPKAQKIIKNIPNLGVILDQNRQIVYANEAITSLLGLSNMNKTLGMRPGELVSCIYSDVTTGGCGTSKECQDCGAVNTIIRCLESRKHEEGTCNIKSFMGGQIVPFKFKISCSPFEAKNDEFFVVASLADIKAEEDKREELMKKVKTSAEASDDQISALNEFIEKVDDTGQMETFLDSMKKGNEDVIDFKRLVAAENGNLKLHLSKNNAFTLLENAVRSTREQPFAQNREIALAPPFPPVSVTTDPIVIEQILRAMLRNALEAETEGGIAHVGYENNENEITFYVFNKEYIPEELQNQIFEKGFTTKISRRGLGTYSMKVLGERYLEAQVGFKSDKDSGTRFHVTLPV